MFVVEWLQVALDELASLWMQADASQREAITSASHTIDERLGANPFGEGESRPGGRRIVFVAPLTVRYQVELDRQTVTDLHVRLFAQRPR